MALVDSPPSPLVGKLTGVHFFGFDGAPCSQRVGFALAEKGLSRARQVKFMSTRPGDLAASEGSYIFRQVSLIKHDNLTAEYAAIQPNMVVPALVHDGKLHIESMEIIEYLDQQWPSNPLIPSDAETAALCHELVELGKALHVSVRHVTFNWSLGKLGKTNKQTQARIKALEQEDSPEQLAAFYQQFNEDRIARETFVEHLNALEDGYAAQDARLASDGSAFLTGDSFTIADIIWAIKVLRLTECGYPFAANFPALAAWYARVEARAGFQQGVMAHHRLFNRAFRLKSYVEKLFGGGITKSSRLAA